MSEEESNFKEEEILEIEFEEIVENNGLEYLLKDDANKNIKFIMFNNNDQQQQLIDLTPLLKLPKLIHLNIDYGFECSCKNNFKNIRELSISSIDHSSLSFLKLFPNIKKLDLEDSSDAEFDLGYFRQLENLKLYHHFTYTKYKENLKNLTQLKNLHLNLSNTAIPELINKEKVTYDLKPLIHLKELKILKLSNDMKRGMKGWPDVEVDCSSIFELSKLEYMFIHFTIVPSGLPFVDLLKNEDEHYDYEIIKDKEDSNYRKYIIKYGGEKLDNFEIKK